MNRRLAIKVLGVVHRPLAWLVLHEQAWRYRLEGDESARLCAVCGGEAPGYMVTDGVWSAAGLVYEEVGSARIAGASRFSGVGFRVGPSCSRRRDVHDGRLHLGDRVVRLAEPVKTRLAA